MTDVNARGQIFVVSSISGELGFDVDDALVLTSVREENRGARRKTVQAQEKSTKENVE